MSQKNKIKSNVQLSVFFMKYLKVTGSELASSHEGTKSLDYGGEDKGVCNVYAPFDLIIVRIDKSANTVFIQSVNKVQTPSFIDFVCATFGHDNYLNSNVKVGAIIKQGTLFYNEGGKGGGEIGKFANHVHVRYGRGRFIDNFWFNIGNGNYEINCTGGAIHHWDAFFVKEDTKILTSSNNPAFHYKWIIESSVVAEEYYPNDQGKRYLFVHSVGVNIRKKLSFFNGKPSGEVMKFMPIGSRIEIVEMMDGLQEDGYQWIMVSYQSCLGYTQFDSKCYSVDDGNH